MSARARTAARAFDDPVDAVRPFAWIGATCFTAGFVAYLFWSLLT